MSCPLFDEFPGAEMPVSQMMPALERVWQNPTLEEAEDPSDARALQMNWVLHCGATTPTQEGLDQFQAIMSFAEMCPSRVIALCANPDCGPLRAKLFAQCYVGGPKLAAPTSEALILSYPADAVGFLKNQVSVWVDNDLPTYYWLHRVDPKKILEYDEYFLKTCKRIVYDSAIEGDCFSGVATTDDHRIVDLSALSMFPIRRILGQFCARYAPKRLVDGLQSVVIEANEKRHAQGKCVLKWLKKTLTACGATPDISFNCVPTTDTDCSLKINWSYKDPQIFLRAQCCDKTAKMTAQCTLEGYLNEQMLPLIWLTPQQLLQSCLG